MKSGFIISITFLAFICVAITSSTSAAARVDLLECEALLIESFAALGLYTDFYGGIPFGATKVIRDVNERDLGIWVRSLETGHEIGAWELLDANGSLLSRAEVSSGHRLQISGHAYYEGLATAFKKLLARGGVLKSISIIRKIHTHPSVPGGFSKSFSQPDRNGDARLRHLVNQIPELKNATIESQILFSETAIVRKKAYFLTPKAWIPAAHRDEFKYVYELFGLSPPLQRSK